MAVTYGWVLENIMSEVRLITGRPDQGQLSDDDLKTRINQYYQYVLPKEMKSFWEYTFFSFYTQANINFYSSPQNFITVGPQAYVDGYPLTWYTDPDLFYQDFPSQPSGKVVVGTGDGVTNSFSFSVTGLIRQGSLYVSDGTQVAKSSARGNFYDPAINPDSNAYTPPNPPPNPASLTGVVNFVTGQVSNMSFTKPPVAGATLTCTFVNYQAGRPRAILFYPQYDLLDSRQVSNGNRWFFNLAPVPDQTYRIRLSGLSLPSPLINLQDMPFRPDLGPLIALGTSLTIFRNANQTDQYNQSKVEFDRYMNVCMQDTYELMLSQRAIPSF